MADLKITQLPAITTPASNDVLPIVNVAGDITSKITYSNLIGGIPTLPINVANGGTGLTTLTSGSVLVGNGTGNVTLVATTGSGSFVRATSPALVTPDLGTPSAAVLTNATGLPLASITNLGSGVATFLGTPSSANLAAAVTGETGTGALVFGSNPNLVKPTFTGSIQIITAMGAQALDGSLGNVFTRTLAGSETFTQSNFSTGQFFLVRVKQGSGTTYTVTWFATVTWITVGGTAPVQTTATNGFTTYGFMCTGTNTFDGYLVSTQ